MLDQGTHASRAIIFSANGELIEKTEQAVSVQHINHQCIEQDANELLESLIICIKKLNKNTLNNVSHCCLCTQRSTVVAWHNKTGRALSPAISWQDRRSDEDLKQFNKQQHLIKDITGLPLSAHYCAGKFRWLMKNNRAVNQAKHDNVLVLAPLVSYLLFHLLSNKPRLVDHSNAHRTLLFELNKTDWSEPLLSLFDIPENLLPKCKPTQFDYGHLIFNDIPMKLVCGDQSAAFFSQGEVNKNTAMINIGSGAFILMPGQKNETNSKLLRGIACSDSSSQTYLLEATVNGAGSAIDWAQQKYPYNNLFECLDDWLEQCKTPAIFINTIGGLGSPWWNNSVDAYFLNDENDINIADRYVAIIESIVFLIHHNLLQLQKTHVLKTLKVSGGLSQLNGLCQKLADLSQLTVQRSTNPEATAQGAAWLSAHCPENWFKAIPEKQFITSIKPDLLSRFEDFTAEIHRLE